jgi:hypothetical protein
MSGVKNALVAARLTEREERMLAMMALGRPVRTIAQLEGLEHDYCRKLVVKLANDNAVEYTPDNTLQKSKMPPVGVTEASRRMRSQLGDILHKLATASDARTVARQIGMSVRSQKYARETPFNHDWTLSEMERLAIACNYEFAAMMREVLDAY